MFKVDNADFIADKLAAELPPDQEYREVLKNALEAVDRRMQAEGVTTGGRVVFDVDWVLLGEDPPSWYLSCSDNGDGMRRDDLERYTTTLAVRGAGNSQSLTGNQGMGLKISGPPRHRHGVVLRSLKAGQRSMVCIGWDPDRGEYGTLPLGDGAHISSPDLAVFPAFVQRAGTGTVVTFTGNSDRDNTVRPDGRRGGWLFKYLNTRFFRLSHDGVEVLVRATSGAPDEWPRTLDAADTSKSWNLQRVKGTAAVWDEATATGGSAGILDLAGDPARDVPPARVHYWVFHPDEGPKVSSRTVSPGSIAVLYQNELHDWRTGARANADYARFGIIFGKSRVSLVVEPRGDTVSSDFARAHVLVRGEQVTSSEAWLAWAEEFRTRTPDAITAAVAEERARLDQSGDVDKDKRVRARLEEILKLLRPRRFRPGTGPVTAAEPTVTGPGDDGDTTVERPTGSGTRGDTRARTRGSGPLLSRLADLTDPAAQPATEVFGADSLSVHWVSESEAAGQALVDPDGKGLHDRAGALAGENGRTAPDLLLNHEFRGFRTLVTAVAEAVNADGNPDRQQVIEATAREWVEQKMIEAIQGLRQLEDGHAWTPADYDDALSPAALTAVFMADRYHTLREVRAVAAKLQAA